MFRPSTVAWATLALTLGGCIQRKLYCPPVASSPGATLTGTGANLVGPTGLKAFAVHGEAEKVGVSVVPVTGQPFAQAIRAEVKKGSNNEWSVQLQAPTLQPVDEGDVLLATFYLRADVPLEDETTVQTQFVFEEAKSPYDKSVTYDIQAGPDWREVHVPFIAKRGFAPGDAHMIFRLGYDPETLEIGGVTIEDFGKKMHLAQLPTTRPWSPPKKATVALQPVDGGPLAIEIDTSKVVGSISPLVYGVNSQPAAGLGVTVRRMGGNRQTAYNWEINASNAGSDYKHLSDAWPCTSLGYTNCDQPAAQFLDFVADNKKLGAETIATVPLIDFVTADKSNTSVTEAEKAPSKRWDKSVPHKPTAYAATPDLNDGTVYEDEFVDFVVRKLGKADAGGIRFYSLDNEPALWPSTHPRVHPEKTTYREMVARTEAQASVLTTIDPSAVLLGGVMFGWSEYQSLNDAPDSKEFNAQYDTYVDYYLASMKQLEAKYHRRLVHALDFHWYPEARGSHRITDPDDSPKTVEARVQAPRALWDPTYREKSWIDDAWKKPIRLIPWLDEKIAKRYPGTKLTMTEYDFGGGEHISGGLAQADVLGILGREGMYLATYWGNGPGNGPLPRYIAAAFKMYRNYDGKGGTYGDTAVTATAPDVVKTSVFAATDSKHPGRLTVVVINKDPRAKFAGTLAIKGGTKYTVAHAYRIDGTAPDLRALEASVTIQDNKLGYDLPPMTATLFVCDAH
jgi:hypothetical protein